MKTTTEIGMNRTGIAFSPKASTETIEFAQSRAPSSEGDVRVETGVLTDYARMAEPAGKVPPPASLTGMSQTLVQKLAGKNVAAFLDKLGQRLAFERAGVRLYDALIAKCRGSDLPAAFGIDELVKIRNDELRHFKVLTACIQELGADPTAMTPCANVVGVESMGLMQVVNEPRMSVVQSLDAIFAAELVDNAAWEQLIPLANALNMTDFAERFRSALEQEEEHLQTVRRWVSQSALSDLEGNAQMRRM
jgi:tRNA isopentenyl-2-thiomethyl-A-37 hydroxylase MiaE